MNMPALANSIMYYYLMGAKPRNTQNSMVYWWLCIAKQMPHFIVFPGAITKCVCVCTYAVK